MFNSSSLDSTFSGKGIELYLEHPRRGRVIEGDRVRLHFCAGNKKHNFEDLIFSYNKNRSTAKLGQDFQYVSQKLDSSRRMTLSKGESCGFVDLRIPKDSKLEAKERVVLSVKPRSKNAAQPSDIARISFSIVDSLGKKDNQKNNSITDSFNGIKKNNSDEESNVHLASVTIHRDLPGGFVGGKRVVPKPGTTTSTPTSTTNTSSSNGSSGSGSTTSSGNSGTTTTSSYAGTGGPSSAGTESTWRRKNTFSSWSIASQPVKAVTPSGKTLWGKTNIADIDHANGHTLIAGSFDKIVTLGGKRLTGWADNTNGFVSKVDAYGNTVWSTQMGGIKDDNVAAVEVFNGGTSRIAGVFRDSAKFGSIELKGSSYSKSVQNGFVARLNANGTFNWAKRFWAEPSGKGYTRNEPFVSIQDIAVANGGYTFAIGRFSGKLYYDYIGANDSLTDVSSQRNFLAKIKPDGQLEWIRPFGGVANAIARYDKDSVVVVGDYSTPTMSTWGNLRGANPGHYISSKGKRDGFLAKFSTHNGFSQWLVNIGGPGDESVRAVDVRDRKIYIGVNWHGDGIDLNNFGGGKRYTTRSSRLTDIVFGSYDGNGNVLHARTFQGDPNGSAGLYGEYSSGDGTQDYVADLVASTDGQILMVGTTSDVENRDLPNYYYNSNRVRSYETCGENMPFMVKFDPITGREKYNIMACAQRSTFANATAVADVGNGAGIVTGTFSNGDLFFGSSDQRYSSEGPGFGWNASSSAPQSFIAKATPNGEWIVGEEAPVGLMG